MHKQGSPAHIKYKERERIRVKLFGRINYKICKEEGRCYRCYVLIDEVKKDGTKPHACKSCRKIHDRRAKLRLIKTPSGGTGNTHET